MIEESTDRSTAERLHATLDGYRLGLDVSEMQQILGGTDRHPAVYLTNRLDCFRLGV
jgi:hypothetical protein